MSGRSNLFPILAALALVLSALAGLSAFAVAAHDGQSGLRAASCPPAETASATATTDLASFTVVLSTTAGDTIAVFVTTGSASTVSGISGSGSDTGWTLDTRYLEPDYGQDTELWTGVAGTTGSDTLTIDSSGTVRMSATAFDIACAVWVAGSSGAETPQTTGDETALTIDFTALNANDLILGLFGENAGQSGEIPTWTNSLSWSDVSQSGIVCPAGSPDRSCAAQDVPYGIAGSTSPQVLTETDTNSADSAGDGTEDGSGGYLMGFYAEFGSPVSEPPAAPTDLTTTEVSTTEIDLAWTNPSGTLTDNGYNLYAGFDCSGSPTFTDLGTVVESASVTGLTDNSEYSFTVEAANVNGFSSPSSCANGVTYPDAPTDLVASETGTTSIDLTWTNPSPNGNVGGGEWTEWSGDACSGDNIDAGPISSGLAAISVTGLTADTTYSFEVEVSNGGYDSAESNCAYATTEASAEFTATPIVLGQTGISSDIESAYTGIPDHAWENISGTGDAPYTYTWSLVYNGTNLSVPADKLGWIQGASADVGVSGEVNVTFNTTGLYTMCVTVTDTVPSSSSTCQIYQYATLYGTSGNPNPFIVAPPMALDFYLSGSGVSVPYSNESFANDTVTIHPIITATAGHVNYCASAQTGLSGADFTAGWRFNGTKYTVNQLTCDDSGAPTFNATTFTLEPGVYHVTAWIQDLYTGINDSFTWTFTILTTHASGGGGGPPLGGIPVVWVVLLIVVVALLAALYAAFGGRRSHGSWNWED
jgi:hypothetical protein